MSYYVMIFWLLLPVVGGMAAIWGGRPERIGAGLYIAAAILTLMWRTHGHQRWVGIETGVLTIDLLLLVAMLILALRSDRWWPMIATAFLSLSMMAHMAKVMDPGFSRLAYALMAGASSYPVVLTLMIAILWRRGRPGTTIGGRSAESSPAGTRGRRLWPRTD